MNEATGRQVLLVSFYIAIGIVTFQEVHVAKIIPRPKRYISAGVVYGILGIVAPMVTYPVAGIFGIGMVLALAYQHYQKGKTLDAPDQPATDREYNESPQQRR